MNVAVDPTYPIIDAWAQPARREAAEKMPEIVRLFKQSGSAHLLEMELTAAQVVEAMDRAGIQVMFGTNFPQLSLEKCVEQVNELGLPEEVKAKFLFQNAQRVFKLGAE
jgi:predicted TIM-barrel fold metal-dependent hydrolase